MPSWNRNNSLFANTDDNFKNKFLKKNELCIALAHIKANREEKNKISSFLLNRELQKGGLGTR